MLYSKHHYSDIFCKQSLKDCLDSIDTQTSFNLVAMPGVGVTFFLNAMAQSNSDNFLFINSYEMHDFSKPAFYEQLSIKLGIDLTEPFSLQKISKALNEKARSLDRLVLVFNRLDRLSEILDQNFYDNMRFLRDSFRDKIVMIFVSSRPMFELSTADVKDALSLITKTIYFPGYSNDDLKEISHSSSSAVIDKKALNYAGGHHALLQVLLRCQNLDNPLPDPMVEMLVKDIYFGLDINRRKQLETFVLRGMEPKDQLLTGLGYIKNGQTFTPLLSNYIKSLGKSHLPVKEKRLMKLLTIHKDKVVSKEEIFDYVWPEKGGIVSEWALNALIYRLRRHATFDNERYSIESRKKDGYILYDHSA